MSRSLQIAALALIVNFETAGAQDHGSDDLSDAVIPGTWFDGGDNVIADPGNLYIYLEADPARLLYENMDSQEIQDACHGGTTKISNQDGFQCSKFSNEVYECALAINYSTGELLNGFVDC